MAAIPCINNFDAPYIYAVIHEKTLYCAWNPQQIVAVHPFNCPRDSGKELVLDNRKVYKQK